MPFTKFVEIGRVVYIAFGRDAGKICTIVDVIDQNRALIDGPCTGVPRQACSFKRLHLTKLRTKFQHSSSTRVVRKAWVDDNIGEKWKESSWAKRLEARKLKAQLSDFDRFKLMKAKQSRNRMIKREFSRLKRKAKKLKLAAKPKPKVAVAKPKAAEKKPGAKKSEKPAAAPKKEAAAKPAAGKQPKKAEAKAKK